MFRLLILLSSLLIGCGEQEPPDKPLVSCEGFKDVQKACL